MLKEGQLVLGEFELPVCMEQLPASYSMLSPEVCMQPRQYPTRTLFIQVLYKRFCDAGILFGYKL